MHTQAIHRDPPGLIQAILRNEARCQPQVTPLLSQVVAHCAKFAPYANLRL